MLIGSIILIDQSLPSPVANQRADSPWLIFFEHVFSFPWDC